MMLCYVCLLEYPSNENAFDNCVSKLNVAEIVNKHLCFKPILNDDVTLKICTDCWNKIYDFHKFYVRVEKLHWEFNGKDKTSTIIIKQENSLTKIEIDENKFSESKELATNSKNPLLQDYEIQNDPDTEEYEPSSSETSDEECEDEETKKISSNKIKTVISQKRTDHMLKRQLINKHILMACHLCIYVGKTFPDILRHFKDHHKNIKPYVMCCDKKFTRGHRLTEHAYVHENPNSFSCTECNKSFTTGSSLRMHIRSYHSSEEKLTYACENCSRKFGRRDFLERHLRIHIPKEEWTFACTKCIGRTAIFATQYDLNRHTRNCHQQEIKVCPECGKEIKNKYTFEKHVRSHFGVPPHSCNFCSKTFNSERGHHYHNKKQHPLEWEKSRAKKTTSLD